MLRLCSKQLIVRRYCEPILYQRVRFNSTNNSTYSHKICALPFKLPEEKVYEIVNICSYMNQHALFGIFKILKSIFTNKKPNFKETVSSLNVRKAYIPFWYYDIAISANIKPSPARESEKAGLGKERQMLGVSLDSFWPGHPWDPVCYLSFGYLPNTLPEKLVPFTPDLYADDDVEVFPFCLDPIKDITNRASTALRNLKVDSMTQETVHYTVLNANVIFNAVYPIYWPVYIAQFTNSKESPKTLVIGAHSDNPPAYLWDPEKKGIEQWMNNGPWLKADVTEADWKIGLANETPLNKLAKRFVTEATAHFETNTIDWNDARVQSYKNYTQKNKDYLKQLFKVWVERSMLSRIKNMDEAQKILGIRGLLVDGRGHGMPILQEKTVREARQEIESRRTDELSKLKKLEPIWFKKYKKHKNQ